MAIVCSRLLTCSNSINSINSKNLCVCAQHTGLFLNLKGAGTLQKEAHTLKEAGGDCVQARVVLFAGKLSHFSCYLV